VTSFAAGCSVLWWVLSVLPALPVRLGCDASCVQGYLVGNGCTDPHLTATRCRLRPRQVAHLHRLLLAPAGGLWRQLPDNVRPGTR